MIPVNLGLRLDSSYPLSGTSLYNLSYHYVLSVLHKNCQKLEQTFLNLNSNTFEGSLKAYSANINSGFQMRIKSLKFHRDRYWISLEKHCLKCCLRHFKILTRKLWLWQVSIWRKRSFWEQYSQWKLKYIKILHATRKKDLCY